MSESNNEPSSENKVPEQFCKVMKDFATDILTTFPEYKETLDAGLNAILNDSKESEEVKKLYQYVKSIYPERFFDLLYQNEDIFTNDEINTEFLPNIDFSVLWKQEISDNTKLVIWKYLQLVLFSAINTESDERSFKDTAKLFEAINEDELKNKLEETMEQMSKIFEQANSVAENSKDNENNNGDNSSFFSADPSGAFNAENLPNPDEIHEHINDMLKGNLGKLATEITEETMKELNEDVSEASTVNDVFQTLFKNPGKLMGMIKKVGNKLDTKLKSGELKESELMEEAMELMEKMDSMPGMKNMKNMLNKMGIPGMGSKNTKMNMGAMTGQLRQNVKMSKQKERMLKKLEARKNAKKQDQIEILQQQLAAARLANQKQQTSQQSINELVASIESSSGSDNKNNKKKKRKKKNKNKKKKKQEKNKVLVSDS